MRTPAFWSRVPPAPMANALRPLGWLYGAITARRMAMAGRAAPVPVVCVGNFTAGGAGKTPVALALVRILRDLGERPVILSRGYGADVREPVRVDPDRHTAADVGDEPLLLARAAPTVVSPDRVAGAVACAEAGASVIVMDDGLQNPRLAKDLTLAVADGRTGIGNGLCLPAGPLRAPMAQQWPFVDALIVLGDGEAGMLLAEDADQHGRPVFQARLLPGAREAALLAGRRVFAFAGIGRPQKFFETLLACGAEVAEAIALPDHHVFRPGEVDRLVARAAAEGLLPVTTEKDMMRIGPRTDVLALPVVAVFDDERALVALCGARLTAARQETSRRP